ncbi:MAG: hypothetical protein AAF749_06760 [Pseudomonadota bacterium]
MALTTLIRQALLGINHLGKFDFVKKTPAKPSLASGTKLPGKEVPVKKGQGESVPSHVAKSGDVSEFLARAKNLQRFHAGRSRLIFAIDATASRQPTWDLACSLQADMFKAGADVASLSVQLAYYRGLGEVHFSHWQSDPTELAGSMSQVFCAAGRTQIAKLLKQALRNQGKQQARALVFIGDAMEESESELRELAGKARILQLPLFMFQEGADARTTEVFTSMATLSGGAFAHFDHSSARRLRELLGAVARYAAGGRAALENKSTAAAQLLLQQLERK